MVKSRRWQAKTTPFTFILFIMPENGYVKKNNNFHKFVLKTVFIPLTFVIYLCYYMFTEFNNVKFSHEVKYEKGKN